ncbi:hydroxyphenylacetyl-CoA thioesterase PaaI [Paracoccus sp. NSM]|uniref:hydroxyphenylacetyl-CoA thioesterase PaaI n=1 Tax=Paracoccus sp. NSM TaxID=3457784 RepID=UPI0040361940
MSDQAMAQACADAMWAEDLASQRLGMVLESVAPGAAVLSMEITPAMVNGHGTAHGGYIFALADSAFAFACNTYDQRTVGQQASITYLAPAFAGDRLTATATERARQTRSGLYDVTVTNQDGTHIAEFRGHSRTVKGRLLGD